MITTIKNSAASAALKLAAGAIATRSSLPVLKNVLIEANGSSRVRFAATDLELSIEAFADAEIEQAGAVTVREQTLSDLLSGLGGDAEIRFEQAGDRMKLLSGRSAYRLPTLAAEEFPSLPDVDAAEEKATIVLPLGEFRAAVARVAPFASDDQTRPILMAVCIRTGEGLTLAATDTHRLSVLTLPHTAQPAREYLVPAKTLLRVAGFTGADADEVEIVLTPNQARFSTPQWRLTTRLIEGRFPRVERIIPDSGSIRWELDTEEFAAALRRVRVLAKDQTKAEMVALHPYEGGLQIRSMGGETGDGVEDVALTQEGEAIDLIRFNAKYLLDACSALGAKVQMAISGPYAGVLFTGEDPALKIVVMVMSPDAK